MYTKDEAKETAANAIQTQKEWVVNSIMPSVYATIKKAAETGAYNTNVSVKRTYVDAVIETLTENEYVVRKIADSGSVTILDVNWSN